MLLDAAVGGRLRRKTRGDRVRGSQTAWRSFMAHRLSIVGFLVGVVAFSAPLFAHHGAASFDSGKTVTVKGTVTEYVWSNPHVLVKVDAKDDSGNVAHWVLEAWNPVTQSSRGWTKNTFKAGDEVSLDIWPD